MESAADTHACRILDPGGQHRLAQRVQDIENMCRLAMGPYRPADVALEHYMVSFLYRPHVRSDILKLESEQLLQCLHLLAQSQASSWTSFRKKATKSRCDDMLNMVTDRWWKRHTRARLYFRTNHTSEISGTESDIWRHVPDNGGQLMTSSIGIQTDAFIPPRGAPLSAEEDLTDRAELLDDGDVYRYFPGWTDAWENSHSHFRESLLALDAQSPEKKAAIRKTIYFKGLQPRLLGSHVHSRSDLCDDLCIRGRAGEGMDQVLQPVARNAKHISHTSGKLSSLSWSVLVFAPFKRCERPFEEVILSKARCGRDM
ncbi:hypothetical protein OE88DRAFT_1668557 [Heliocybe sulcata]|uniref:Uncharacterized protein n=1 Tax=Heliocybe sulcata TaxID=5364 RepID=A0A5C3MKV1_9AGAM|nr:hypothetical protein OE88DRAFT_1668557 [Heliocybe sulcata]